jgi:hypothetical protein
MFGILGGCPSLTRQGLAGNSPHLGTSRHRRLLLSTISVAISREPP